MSEQSAKIFVGGVPIQVSNEGLKECFKKFGSHPSCFLFHFAVVSLLRFCFVALLLFALLLFVCCFLLCCFFAFFFASGVRLFVACCFLSFLFAFCFAFKLKFVANNIFTCIHCIIRYCGGQHDYERSDWKISWVWIRDV